MSGTMRSISLQTPKTVGVCQFKKFLCYRFGKFFDLHPLATENFNFSFCFMRGETLERIEPLCIMRLKNRVDLTLIHEINQELFSLT